MFYSKLTNGFYHEAIHGDNIPQDAVKITPSLYDSLMEAQSLGKLISTDENGRPIAIDHPQPCRTITSLLADVAAKRWEVETGGIIVDGLPINTDRESQSQLTSAYTMLKSGLISDTQWKAADGSFTLVTLAELEPIAQAVARHARSCFDAERAHSDAIALLQTQVELDAYDISFGWPTNPH